MELPPPVTQMPMSVHGTRAILRANLRCLQSTGALSSERIESLQQAFGAPSEPSIPGPPTACHETILARSIGQTLAPRGPLVLVGMIPELLESTDRALMHAERGKVFVQRVLIVEPRLRVAARILSRGDLATSLLRPDRFVLMVGDDAEAQLERWLTDRIESSLPSMVLPIVSDDLPDIQRKVECVLDAVASQQVARQRELLAATERQGGDAAADGLAARRILQEGAAGTRSLRFLLCGSLYTTYVRHSLEGLAAALRSLGHTVELLIEPDESSTLTALAYRRAVLETAPDLIVTANYPRALLGAALPNHIPHVCWIQDSMPHLLDEKVGKRIGETEFFIGNTLPELSETFGYPRHTLVPSCVPASEHRFHPGVIEQPSRDRWSCDVAFVSHHSETPEAMRDRLIREISGDAQGRTIVTALWDAMPALLNESARSPLGTSADCTVREQVGRALGHEISAAQCSMIRHRVALPLLGRMFRHEALHWAASICARRGWSFRLYGNGWERTPGLAPHAVGPLEHGEPLRACYQAARVHLHLDPNTLTHQRVFECAMSGGLPIARFHHDALNPLLIAAADEARDAHAEDWPAVPLGRRYMAACNELGTTPMPCVEAIASMPQIGQATRESMLRVFDPHWLCAGLGDVTFHDEPSLERVLERAIEDDDWRAERSASMRLRMIEGVGMRAFAQRMLDAACRIIGWKSECIKNGFGWPPRADWAEYARRKEPADAA